MLCTDNESGSCFSFHENKLDKNKNVIFENKRRRLVRAFVYVKLTLVPAWICRVNFYPFCKSRKEIIFYPPYFVIFWLFVGTAASVVAKMSSSETVLSKRYAILTPGSKQRIAKHTAIYEIHMHSKPRANCYQLI